MPTKDRLLVLLQTLQKHSDSDTWLTTADFRTALEKEGHGARSGRSGRICSPWRIAVTELRREESAGSSPVCVYRAGMVQAGAADSWWMLFPLLSLSRRIVAKRWSGGCL